MKKISFAVILFLTIFVHAHSVYALSVVGSKHDFSFTTGFASAFQFDAQNVCIFCHTPHHANTAAPVLWNRSLPPSGTFSLYSSPTLQATQNLDTSKFSLMCLSCHDGATAINAVLNKWSDTFNPIAPSEDQIGDVTPIGVNIGGLDDAGNPVGPVNDSLRNDHPVGFSYTNVLVAADQAAGGFAVPQLAAPDNVNGFVVDPRVRLFSSGLQRDMLECGSCHDPHDNQFGSFLVKSNVNSALCTTCHLK